MRGADTFTEGLFTLKKLDDFVPVGIQAVCQCPARYRGARRASRKNSRSGSFVLTSPILNRVGKIGIPLTAGTLVNSL